jgi:cellulose synthase/poly-beta-1,6-N-acetylglucosamine synthase-like glycosyltransferase
VKVSSVTVLVCTYNRARLLRETLAAMQAMEPPADCSVEIIVVDNNSTDNTPLVIAESARAGRYRIVPLHERKQGKSFALNHGLSQAHGDVLALTDDDVIPSPDWIHRLVDDFRTHDVTFVCGKVLPRWSRVPPPELLMPRAMHIWGPIAIIDYGDGPIEYVAENRNQWLPIGANLAFSREALLTIGGWRTDLGKVNNTLISGEDHEIFMRLRRFGLYAGYYDPTLIVRHYVPAERLTRHYFRQWFFWHGKTRALMIEDLYPDVDLTRVPRVAGVPRFLYREVLAQVWRWLRTRGSHDALKALHEELRLLQFAGLISECWRRRHAAPGPVVAERLSKAHAAK